MAKKRRFFNLRKGAKMFAYFMILSLILAIISDYESNRELFYSYVPYIVLVVIIIALFKPSKKKSNGESSFNIKINSTKIKGFRLNKKKKIVIVAIAIVMVLFIENYQLIINSIIGEVNNIPFDIILFLFIVLLVIIASIKVIPNKIMNNKIAKSGISEIDIMTGEQFEQYLEMLFKKKGYQVERTPISGDYGADLIIVKGPDRIAVQAKRYTETVGLHAVQEVVGALGHYHCKKGIVVTNSYFTSSAKKLGESNNIELWDRDRLIKELLTK